MRQVYSQCERSVLRLICFLGVATCGLLVPSGVDAAARPEAAAGGVRAEYRSRNFIVYTDLDKEEAEALLDDLETMLRIISRYWGARMQKTVPCYVVKDLDNWGPRDLPPDARVVVAGGGVTKAQGRQFGNRINLNATVYASSKFGTPKHEAVHAYCYLAFGRTGPTWYAEGMAEMGNYWQDGDETVTAPQYVLQYLKRSPFKTVHEITDDRWGTGDGWQNYAWRWALCHFLVNNANYNERFRVLGVSFLAGRPASFERTYAAKMEELEFEFDFFVKHLQQGFNVNRCSWDWTARYRLPTAKRMAKARILADHGWQPSRAKVEEGQTYSYTASGEWSVRDDETLTANGRADGSGRLTGVILDDYSLSEEFLLGADGTFVAPASGNLLLRCRDEWAQLEDNSGSMSVEVTAAAEDDQLE